MLNQNKVLLEELKNVQDKYYISKIEERSYDNAIILYISIDHLSETVRSGAVSKLQLELLIRNLSTKYSTKLEILYIESHRLNDLAKGIELILKAQFNNFIKSINLTFLSSEKVTAEIFTQNLDQNNKLSIAAYLTSTFKSSNIEVENIEWLGDIDQYPSTMEILIALKKMQPISLEYFLENLNADFKTIDQKWLNRQLDKLIKKGLLIRDNISKQYALSWQGLSIIPNVSNISNSDIKRALSLGRRKW